MKISIHSSRNDFYLLIIFAANFGHTRIIGVEGKDIKRDRKFEMLVVVVLVVIGMALIVSKLFLSV